MTIDKRQSRGRQTIKDHVKFNKENVKKNSIRRNSSMTREFKRRNESISEVNLRDMSKMVNETGRESKEMYSNQSAEKPG